MRVCVCWLLVVCVYVCVFVGCLWCVYVCVFVGCLWCVCVCWLLVVCVCVFVCLCVCVCVCVFVACEHKHEGKSELGVLDACARRGLGTHLFWQITASAYSAGLHWHPKPCILTLCWSYLSL